MEYILPLFISFFILAILIFGGSFVIASYRTSIKNGESANEDAVHSMLGSLQESLEKGEISPEEYRVVKTQLTAELQDLVNRR